MTKQTSTKPSIWEVIKALPMEEKKCKHVFKFVEKGECKCINCGFGLVGVIDIVDGRPV